MVTLDGAYEDDNVFAKIIRGEIPAAKVYEDERVLVILDAFPQSNGHTLVIHKRSRARNILDVEPGALSEIMAAVQKAARALRRTMAPEGLVVTQFNGAAAGQTIPHLHFHIIPRWTDRPMGRHGEGMADLQMLQGQAALIAAQWGQ